MTIKPSEIIAKTPLVSGVTPANDVSQYPTHYDIFGYGGHRSADDETQRLAIPAARRVVGMLVYQVDTNQTYQLIGGITDSDWQATGLLPWVAGEDYFELDERIYDFKLYIAQERINDGRTTTPDNDGDGWKQPGSISNYPKLPIATTSDAVYAIEQRAATPEAGVTIVFGTAATGNFDRSYIGGFPSAVSNINNGTLIQFQNNGLRPTRVGGDLNIGNLTGTRVSLSSGTDNNTLTQKVAEWAALINGDARFNLEARVNELVDTTLDLFYLDTEIDIDPNNIVAITQNDIGLTIRNDFNISANTSAPTKIVEAPLPITKEITTDLAKTALIPNTIGTKDQVLAVNADADALEYVDQSGGEDNNLPDPPDAQATTKDYTLRRVAATVQIGRRLTFTGVPVAITGQEFSNVNITAPSNVSNIQFYGRLTGRTVGWLYVVAGTTPDGDGAPVIGDPIIQTGGGLISIQGQSVSGSLDDLVLALNYESTNHSGDWVATKVGDDAIELYSKTSETDYDVAFTIGNSGAWVFTQTQVTRALSPAPAAWNEFTAGAASVTFADVITGGTYGAEGTSTGGGSLDTLAVLYKTVQYYRIFAANGLSEILSTSTDETNTSAQIYTRTYEVA